MLLSGKKDLPEKIPDHLRNAGSTLLPSQAVTH